MKKERSFKSAIWFLMMLVVAALLLFYVVVGPTGTVAPADYGYPAPVDGWCEEAALLELPLPAWCMSVTAPVATATAWAYPVPGHIITDDALTIMKTGGRTKGKQ